MGLASTYVQLKHNLQEGQNVRLEKFSIDIGTIGTGDGHLDRIQL